MELWNYITGNPEENKKKMIDLFVSYLPGFYNGNILYNLDMRDEWWNTFIKENCPELYPKIDWSLFITPEVDLDIKLNSD